MNYRLATEEDIQTLGNLRFEHEQEFHQELTNAVEDYYNEFNRFVSKGLQDRTLTIWIAEENGQIVSNVWLIKIRKVPKPQKLEAYIGYVTNVHTKHEYRNRGIGSELMKRTNNWANENGCELLFLWPSTKSIPFYLREGFSQQNDIVELIL